MFRKTIITAALAATVAASAVSPAAAAPKATTGDTGLFSLAVARLNAQGEHAKQTGEVGKITAIVVTKKRGGFDYLITTKGADHEVVTGVAVRTRKVGSASLILRIAQTVDGVRQPLARL